MMWTLEASSVAYITSLNPETKNLAETIAHERGCRAVTHEHLQLAVKQLENQWKETKTAQFQNSQDFGHA